MGRRPSALAEVPAAEKAPAAEPPATGGRGHRLTDAQRAEILRLRTEGHTNGRIAELVRTTPATVGRVLMNAGISGRRRGGGEAMPASAAMTDIQRRLMQIGVAYLMGDAMDPNEITDLKTILNERLEEARRRATMEALRSL